MTSKYLLYSVRKLLNKMKDLKIIQKILQHVIEERENNYTQE